MVKTATQRSTTRDHFTHERTYDASPATVFAAWADLKQKQEWWGGPDGWKDEHKLDFRVGGREWQRTTSPEGDQYTFNGEYLDIVPDERIVYAYTMDDKTRRISASLATVEFKPAGGKTVLVLTEDDVFLDDKDEVADFSGGMKATLESLGRFLKTAT